MTNKTQDSSLARVRTLVWLMALLAVCGGASTLWYVRMRLQGVEAHHHKTEDARSDVLSAVERLREYRIGLTANSHTLWTWRGEGEDLKSQLKEAIAWKFDAPLVVASVGLADDSLRRLGGAVEQEFVALGELQDKIEQVHWSIKTARIEAVNAAIAEYACDRTARFLRSELNALSVIVSRAVGLKKLAVARRLAQSKGEGNERRLEQSLEITEGLRHIEKLRQLQDDLNDLALATELLIATDAIDELRNLKDNRLRQSLMRLKRNAIRLPAKRQLFTERLAAFETTLLGDEVEGRPQPAEAGAVEGGLYQQKSWLFETRNLLSDASAKAETLTDACRQAEQKLGSLVARLCNQAVYESEWQLRSASSALLVVAAIASIIFIVAAWLIVSLVSRVMLVSAQRQADRESLLQESVELANIIRDSPNELYFVDAQTYRFVEVNQGACDSSGYSAQELFGLGPLDINHDIDLAKLAELYEPLLTGAETTIEIQGRHQRKDGTSYPVQVHIHKSIYQGKQVFVSFVSDQTDLQQLERQLLHAQKLESIGQLTAGIAHEINTPMQCVVGNMAFLRDNSVRLCEFIDLSIKGLQAPTEVAEEATAEAASYAEQNRIALLAEQTPSAIDDAIEAASRVVEIVRAMKTLSHPGTVEKVNADVNDILRSAATVSKNRWKCSAKLHLELDAALPNLLGLPAELSQVFLNLFVNAADAITEHRKGKQGMGDIWVRSSSDAEHIRIEVQDTGGGMPEAVRCKVFDPFFTTKEVGKGTGQGLAISYDVIVNKHEGTLEVETEEGVGSTFIVSLPYKRSSNLPERLEEELTPPAVNPDGTLEPIYSGSV